MNILIYLSYKALLRRWHSLYILIQFHIAHIYASNHNISEAHSGSGFCSRYSDPLLARRSGFRTSGDMRFTRVSAYQFSISISFVPSVNIRIGPRPCLSLSLFSTLTRNLCLELIYESLKGPSVDSHGFKKICIIVSTVSQRWDLLNVKMPYLAFIILPFQAKRTSMSLV